MSLYEQLLDLLSINKTTIIHQYGDYNSANIESKITQISQWQYERDALASELNDCYRREAELTVKIIRLNAAIRSAVTPSPPQS